MSVAKEIIEQASSLSVDEQLMIVDSLLHSLNPPDPKTDRAWAVVAEKRLEELRSGKVKPVPGEQVLAKIQDRFRSS